MLLADRLASTVAPGDRRLAAGRVGNPDVLADLRVHDQAAQIGGLPQQVGAERHGVPADGDGAAVGPVAADEMPRLVEFPVVRQVDLRHHAEQRAAMDGKGAVIQRAKMPQRRPHQQQRHQVGRPRDDRLDRRLHRVQQRRLLQQVADGIAGNPEFREHRHRHRLPVAILGHAQDRLRVGRRVGQRRAGGASGDTGEAVAIKGTETHGGPGLCCR